MDGSREARILAGTYQDRLWVYRKRTETDPDTLESVEKEYTVYDGIPCALSQGSGQAPDRQEFHSEKNRDSVLFTAPSVFLQDNDRVVVETRAGQTVHGRSGHTFGYVSHGETPVATEGLA